MSFYRQLFVIILLVGGLLVPLQSQARELTVSAAASLTDAFNEMKSLFEKKYPDLKVNVNYAASNPLLRQIVAGAPVDVFASADQATMDAATKEEVIEPSSRKNFASNELVLIVPKDGKKAAKLEDLSAFEKIAIGNPDSVPAGRYAKDALEKASLWEKLQPKFIKGESVRQALEYVARGEVDAGLVYRTDAAHKKDDVEIVLVLEASKPVTYPIALALTGDNPQAGQEFINFVLSPEGQAVLAKYGFAKP